MPAKTNKTQTKNKVTLTGKLCELKVTRGTKANPNEEVIRLDGSIMLNNDPNFKIGFRNAFPVRKFKKDGDLRKDYPKYLVFATNAKPVSEVGTEHASVVTLSGRVASNDFYNENGDLVEATMINPISIDIVADSAEDKDETIFQGMVRKQTKEMRDGEETGRIRAEVIGIDGMGTAIPFKFIVPEQYAEAFEDRYVPHTSATFSLKHELTAVEHKKSTGGIGEQWTEGKPRINWLLCGATDPFEDDDERGISKATVKMALEKRNENLERQKAYRESQQQQGRTTITTGTTSVSLANNWENDPDELPF